MATVGMKYALICGAREMRGRVLEVLLDLGAMELHRLSPITGGRAQRQALISLYEKVRDCSELEVPQLPPDSPTRMPPATPGSSRSGIAPSGSTRLPPASRGRPRVTCVGRWTRRSRAARRPRWRTQLLGGRRSTGRQFGILRQHRHRVHAAGRVEGDPGRRAKWRHSTLADGRRRPGRDHRQVHPEAPGVKA